MALLNGGNAFDQAWFGWCLDYARLTGSAGILDTARDNLATSVAHFCIAVLSLIEEQMNREQMADAQARARRCLSSNYQDLRSTSSTYQS